MVISPGDNVNVSPDLSRIMIFDVETGARL
jgi:hypothetical protein